MSNGVVIVPFLLVAAHVDVPVIGAAIRQPVNEPGIAVIREDHRLVAREQRVELLVAESVRMLALGLQPHQIDDVHHPNLQFRNRASEQRDRGQRFQCRHVTGSRHHQIGLTIVIVARPVQRPIPAAQCRAAAVHVQPLRRRVLSRDDDVDVVATAQAVIHHAQQTVGIGGQIDAHDLGALVQRDVDETGILMSEAVVILPPDMARQQIVQRRDRMPPGKTSASSPAISHAG